MEFEILNIKIFYIDKYMNMNMNNIIMIIISLVAIVAFIIGIVAISKKEKYDVGGMYEKDMDIEMGLAYNGCPRGWSNGGAPGEVRGACNWKGEKP